MIGQAERKNIEVLDQLIAINGYLASAILSIEGELFYQHTMHDEFQTEMAGFILAIVENATLSVYDAKLGKCGFIQVDSNKGILIIMRAGVDKIIISALFDNESMVGRVKLAMINVLDLFIKQPENYELLAAVEKKPDIVARYVSSSEHTVHQMLKFANVKPMDVLYDLGCGDATVLVYAANTYSVEKSVGIECRAHVAALAKKKILKNNLENKISIIENDLFDIDLECANVVFIYLSKKAGKKLTQLFLKSLKKGSRIVSQAFPLRYIEPDDIYQDVYCKLYLYTIK